MSWTDEFEIEDEEEQQQVSAAIFLFKKNPNEPKDLRQTK